MTAERCDDVTYKTYQYYLMHTLVAEPFNLAGS